MPSGRRGRPRLAPSDLARACHGPDRQAVARPPAPGPERPKRLQVAKPWLQNREKTVTVKGRRRKSDPCTAGGTAIRRGGSVYGMLREEPGMPRPRRVCAGSRGRAEAAAAWNHRVRRAYAAAAVARLRRRPRRTASAARHHSPAAGPPRQPRRPGSRTIIIIIMPAAGPPPLVHAGGRAPAAGQKPNDPARPRCLAKQGERRAPGPDVPARPVRAGCDARAPAPLPPDPPRRGPRAAIPIAAA